MCARFASVPTSFVSHPTSFANAPTGFVSAPTRFVCIPTSFGNLPTSIASLPTRFGKLPTSFVSIPTSFAKLPTSFALAPTNVVHSKVMKDANATAVTPAAAIEQIRALRATLPEVATLTPKQRKMLRNSSQTDPLIVQSSLNTIGVSDVVAVGVGQPLENVRVLQQQAILWRAVEEEARNLLAGLAGANALRRDQLALLGIHAYAIASQAARVPENEVLISHVEEIRRLKRIARRKKGRKAPAAPPADDPSAE